MAASLLSGSALIFCETSFGCWWTLTGSGGRWSELNSMQRCSSRWQRHPEAESWGRRLRSATVQTMRITASWNWPSRAAPPSLSRAIITCLKCHPGEASRLCDRRSLSGASMPCGGQLAGSNLHGRCPTRFIRTVARSRAPSPASARRALPAPPPVGLDRATGNGRRTTRARSVEDRSLRHPFRRLPRGSLRRGC